VSSNHAPSLLDVPLHIELQIAEHVPTPVLLEVLVRVLQTLYIRRDEASRIRDGVQLPLVYPGASHESEPMKLTTSEPPLACRLVSVLIAALLIATAFLAATPGPASASDGNFGAVNNDLASYKATSCTTHVGVTMPSGPGHSDGPVWSGTFKCGKFVGFCGDFALHNPNSSSGTAVFSKWPGLSKEKSKIAAYITATYQDTGDPYTAASAAMAVWGVIGSPAFNKYNAWLTNTGQFPDIRARAAQMTAEATEASAPKATVTLTPAYTGQTSAGNVQVTGTSGLPLGGLKVKLDANKNGKLDIKSGVTDANGMVAFNLKKTGYGAVKVEASVSIIDTGYILRTSPSVGRQRIFRVPRMKQINANASYNLKLGTPTVQTVCDTDCSGNATVTVSFCNPAGAATYRLFGQVGDHTVLKQDFPGDGSCPAYQLRLHDENVLVLSYCLVKKGKCFTNKFQTVVYEVKCPPAPEVWFSSVCTCNGLANFNVLVKVPASGRIFTASATVNDVLVMGATQLTPGQDNVLPIPGVTAGSTVAVTVQVTHQATGELMASWTFTGTAPTTTSGKAVVLKRK